MADGPRWRRALDLLATAIGRPLLFAFWAFALWGTLLIAVFGVRVASAGLSEAVAGLWPERVDGLVFVNLGAVILAAVVWLAVSAIAFLSRRPRP